MIGKESSNLILVFDIGYRVVDGKLLSEKSKEIKAHLSMRGYLYAMPTINGKQRRVLIHRMVAYEKYGNEIFHDGIKVRHKNGNPLDNCFDNILIGTPLST